MRKSQKLYFTWCTVYNKTVLILPSHFDFQNWAATKDLLTSSTLNVPFCASRKRKGCREQSKRSPIGMYIFKNRLTIDESDMMRAIYTLAVEYPNLVR